MVNEKGKIMHTLSSMNIIVFKSKVKIYLSNILYSTSTGPPQD